MVVNNVRSEVEIISALLEQVTGTLLLNNKSNDLRAVFMLLTQINEHLKLIEKELGSYNT